MRTAVAFSTTGITGAIGRNNMKLAVNDSVVVYPTVSTGFYNSIAPRPSGYTIYINKASGGPAVYSPANDDDLVSTTSAIGAPGLTNAAGALAWLATQSGMICVNRIYEEIVTTGLISVLDPGFVASYPRGGTSMYDLSGTANNGTLTNGPIYSLTGGGYFTYDGINEFTELPASSLGSATASYTLGAMVNVNVFDATNNSVAISRGRDGFGSGWSVLLAMGGTGVPLFAVVTTVPSTAAFSAVGTASGATGTWYYLAGSWQAGTAIKVYLDGVLRGTTNTSTTTLRSSSAGFSIASIASTVFYNGSIGHCHIYNRVLSDAEILQNYNALKIRYGLASEPLLLDTYSQATAAYSLRKLSTSYAGSAIRVRRSSDNTEQDIGFANNVLNTSTLLTFCGTGNGFVTTWYDQSGNTRHFSQTTALSQPMIVSSGAVELVNNKPAIYFDGIDDSISNGFGSSVNAAAFTIFDVFKINDPDNFVTHTLSGNYILAGNTTNPAAPDAVPYISRYKNSALTSTTTQIEVKAAYSTNTQILFTEIVNTTSANSFGISNFASWPMTGHFQECILYLEDQSSNRAGIEYNINSYYTIY
jgi:hypothetical protein